MGKFTNLFILALLLSSMLTYAARPAPATAFPAETAVKITAEDIEVEMAEESCEGVSEEECLKRRTLAAHTDYIYTQKHKP